VVINNRTETLVALFPDLYPYFRFEVFGPDVGLSHHQNPMTGAFCLIGRATQEWRVTDTLAAFLTERLPRTLQAGGAEDVTGVEEEEQHQAEPFSDYYPYPASAVLLVDSGWDLSGAARGSFDARVMGDSEGRIRGAVLRVVDEEGSLIAQGPTEWEGLFEIPLRGRWIRLPAPLREADASMARLQAAEADPWLQGYRWTSAGRNLIDIAGVVFPEEVGWRETGDGWVFLVSLARPRR